VRTPCAASAALLTALLLQALPAVAASPVAASPAAATPPAAQSAAPGKKAADPAERERALKAEEERLLALRKDVDEKIAKYEKLLGQVEDKERRKQDEAAAKVDQLVKLFEAMPPEGAATRLAALDDEMAVSILARMKSRKASAVLTLMEPKRVALLARKMAGVKNFPAE